MLRATDLTWQVVPVSPKTNWIFLCLTLEGGTQGWGEATMFGQETAIAALLETVVAEIAASRPQLPRQIMNIVASRHDSTALMAVRHGLEQAVHDGMARSAGLTLSHLLGGPHRDGVPLYANINRGIEDRSPEGFAERARDVVGRHGYNAIKIAPFDGLRAGALGWGDQNAAFERGIERIAAVRDAIGGAAGLLVDCHARFDIAGAHRLIDAIAPFDIFWVEEPVDENVADFSGRRALRSQANARGMRVAGLESTRTLAELGRALDEDIYDCILPDLRFTGLHNGVAMLRLAGARGVGVSIHNPAGPVLDAVSRSVAAALPEFTILERQVGESPLFEKLGGRMAPLVSGGIRVEDDASGHGFTPPSGTLEAMPKWDGVARFQFSGIAGAGPDA